MKSLTDDEPVAAAGAPGAFTLETVEAVLDGWGASYHRHDTDIIGMWEGHIFVLHGTEGAVLSIRGRWGREIGTDQLERVVELLNSWNHDNPWPTAYVGVERVVDTEQVDRLGLYGQVSMRLRKGVTRGQLEELMACALSSALRLFAHLDEHYPQAAAAARRRAVVAEHDGAVATTGRLARNAAPRDEHTAAATPSAGSGPGDADGGVPPFTGEAVVAVLDRWGVPHRTNDDGDIQLWSGGHVFVFTAGGGDCSVLSVRGTWTRLMPADRLGEVAELLNGWNRDNRWPQAFARVGRTGTYLGVFGEVSTPLRGGITHEQLDDLMRVAMEATLLLFDHLDRHFPQVAASA